MITPDDWKEPRFDKADKCHDWKNYITAEIQGMWPTIYDELKQALARQAEFRASIEEWE